MYTRFPALGSVIFRKDDRTNHKVVYPSIKHQSPENGHQSTIVYWVCINNVPLMEPITEHELATVSGSDYYNQAKRVLAYVASEFVADKAINSATIVLEELVFYFQLKPNAPSNDKNSIAQAIFNFLCTVAEIQEGENEYFKYLVKDKE